MMNSPGSVAVNIKPDAKFRVHTARELLFCFAQEVVRWKDLQLKKKNSHLAQKLLSNGGRTHVYAS